MMVAKRCLPRRTVLRGLGAAIALPHLSAMTPAFAAPAVPARRLAAVYAQNGMNMAKWTQATDGSDYALTSLLEPLASVRDRLFVLSGLSSSPADGVSGEGSGDHSRAQTAFLTGTHARKSMSEVQAGVSMD